MPRHLIGGMDMWFGNLRLIFFAETHEERLDALGKIIVSIVAFAFVAAAFSDVWSFPEKWTVATGGLLGFLVGAAKLA